MNTNPHTAALLAALRNIVDHDGQHIQTDRLHTAIVAIQGAEQSIALAGAESAQSATKSVAKLSREDLISDLATMMARHEALKHSMSVAMPLERLDRLSNEFAVSFRDQLDFGLVMTKDITILPGSPADLLLHPAPVTTAQ